MRLSSTVFAGLFALAALVMGATNAQAFSDDPSNPFNLFDANGTPASQSIFPFSATVDFTSRSDVDYIFLGAPAGQTCIVRMIPSENLEVQMEFLDFTTGAVLFTRNLGTAGEVEWENIPDRDNDSETGRFLRISAGPGTATDVGLSYTLEVEVIPTSNTGGFAFINNKPSYREGETFQLDLGVINTSDMNIAYNVYAAFEVAGLVYWGAFDSNIDPPAVVWTEAFQFTPNFFLTRFNGAYLRDPLTFTVTAPFTQIPPVTFFYASQDPTSGEFSNVAALPVTFTQ